VRHLIETTRLRLTAVCTADVDELYRIFGDPSDAFSTLHETRIWVERRIDAARVSDLVWYVLRDRRSGELVGTCGLFAGRTGAVEPEIGYEIVPDHRGKGYATEAARAVLAEAEASGVPRVWTTIRPGNCGSLRVAMKIGMTYSHRRPDERGDMLYLAHPPAPHGSVPRDPAFRGPGFRSAGFAGEEDRPAGR
jgi:[ribosomal protein S5]-alanine N-acetyltransferase